ncbi:unnamed protein product, partial [Mesorhabditis spiculigera]
MCGRSTSTTSNLTDATLFLISFALPHVRQNGTDSQEYAAIISLLLLLEMAVPEDRDEKDGAFRRFVTKIRGKKEKRDCFHCSTPTTQGPLYGVIICPSCQKKAGPWARSAKPCCQRMKGCDDLAIYVDDIGFAEAELEAYTRILEILRGRACWYCQIVATPLARAVTDWKGQQAPGKTRGARRAAAPAATTIIGMLLFFMLLGMATATSSGAKRAAAPVATNIIGMLLIVFMLLGMSTATSTTYDELERGDLYGLNQYKSQLFANQFEYDAVHLFGVVERYQQKWKLADQLANDLDDKCQQHEDDAFAKDERIRKLEAERCPSATRCAAFGEQRAQVGLEGPGGEVQVRPEKPTQKMRTMGHQRARAVSTPKWPR